MFSSAIHLVSYAFHTVSRLFHLASDPCVSFHLSFWFSPSLAFPSCLLYLYLREGVSLLAFIHMSLFYYLLLYYLLSTLVLVFHPACGSGCTRAFLLVFIIVYQPWVILRYCSLRFSISFTLALLPLRRPPGPNSQRA